MTPASSAHFDLIVIGSGSAASAAWIEAARLGRRVAVFEHDTLGGECPTHACVPTKTLLRSAEARDAVREAPRFGVHPAAAAFDYAAIRARKDAVVAQSGAARGEAPFVDAGVHLVRERARFVAEDAVEAAGVRYTADRFLVATGSRVAIPDVPGLAEAGYLTFREAVDLAAPPQRIAILGGGAVGCEFAQLFSAFDSVVTLVQSRSALLASEEAEAGATLARHFTARGVRVLTSSQVIRVATLATGKRLTLETPTGSQSMEVDEVLVATGKSPDLDFAPEAAGIETSAAGVEVDETLRTTNERVYAAGDVVGPYRFTHAASYQGTLAVRNALGVEARLAEYTAIPRCVFTSPEVAAVGLTESAAREQHGDVRTGVADLAEITRAETAGDGEGFAKVVATTDGTIVGATIVSPRAGELIHELALAITLGAKASQVAAMVHAFPTYSELVREACMKV